MSTLASKEIRLAGRPQGAPTADNFEVAETQVAAPGEGEVRVRNLWMSVDPYMRARMIDDPKHYISAFQMGKALEGGAIGVVVDSGDPNFAPGDHVQSMMGWREIFNAPGSALNKVDTQGLPLHAPLHIAGLTGLTAYYGLLKIGQPKEGETVFVSAAAGAVGSIVSQIAKIKGCRVVGTAGSDEKCEWLESRGVDKAINYKTAGNLVKAVREAAPDGVDVYFENVGGDHLIAALENMNEHGRIPVCGMISGYNAEKPEPGPPNLFRIIQRKLLLQGFIVSDHFDVYPEFIRDLAGWIKDGKVQWQETVVEGIDNAPDAFLRLFSGEKTGKMLVKLGEDDG
ncbi:NADP-dependent oxidoreductase [Euryhalocaulis caribicus]|uniref:NADP-dependent oxidoreductase n=1 Tax=Euryhalocaulis caribicus TaxID=1161401 RepID=UPI0003A85212|nr:NADP-dependent oxidoreductase [Euryhalocaulis caribicus]